MELRSLYRSPNIVRVIKSRRLKWAGHVARMEESRSSFNILTGTPTGNRPLGTLGIDGRTTLEWTLNRYQYAKNWVDSAQESPCECVIEPPVSTSHGVS